MKKTYLALFSLFTVFFTTTQVVNAQESTLRSFLSEYITTIAQDIPQSYQYIEVHYPDIEKSDPFFSILQKGIYMNIIDNKSVSLPREENITQEMISSIVKENFKLSIPYKKETIADELFMSKYIPTIPSYKQHRCSDLGGVITKVRLIDYEIAQASNFLVLNDIYKRLTETSLYKDQHEAEELIHNAIEGIIEPLESDAYIDFMKPKDYKTFEKKVEEGLFYGIGVSIKQHDKGSEILSVLQGSSAQKADLKKQDIITHINNKSIAGREEKKVIEHIKGKENTEIELYIEREEKNLTKKVTRSPINIIALTHKKITPTTYYIDINNFDHQTASLFNEAVQSYQKGNYKKLIIDLRDNPGGSLQQAHQMLEHFVSSGTALYSLENIQKQSGSVYAQTASKKRGKIKILINQGTASASELMALVLQENNNATLIGEQSFGKGVAQDLILYKNGSALKYTNNKRYPGNNFQKNINEKGITPDHKIQRNQQQFNEKNIDNQLQFAKTH